MNCNCPGKFFSHSSHTGLRILFAVIVCLLLVGGLAWYFRFHLLWKYTEWRYELHEVKAIPNNPMPETLVPEDWVEHSFNGISFRLPPDMALMQSSKYGSGFANDSMIIGIIVIQGGDAENMNALAGSTSSQFFPPSSRPVTMTQLRLECLSVGADDFRWSMSPKEAQRLAFLLAMRGIVCIGININKSGTTEFFSRDGKEGILFVAPYPERNTLAWQSTACHIGGFIHFRPSESHEEAMNMDWIRSVCESITIDQAETETTSECH